MGARVSSLSVRSLLLASACVFAAPTGLLAQEIQGALPETLSDSVNRQLDLTESAIFSLAVSGEPGQAIRTTVPLHGVPFTLDLAPHSTRSEVSYQVLVQGADGNMTEAEPSPVLTLRGTVVGMPGSVVAGTYDELGGLYARIRFEETEEEFWVEQLSAKLDGFAPDLHVVYSSDAVISSLGQCGVTALPTIDKSHVHGGKEFGGAPACGVGLCLAQLGCDADFQYFQQNGASVGSVESKINTIINLMNVQYESEVDIRHDITAIVVRTGEPDPYNGGSINDLLSQLRSEWQGPLSGTPHDVAQLFTGTNLSGGVIGLAWLSGVCGNLRYSVVEDFTSSMACLTDLSAHELGHNWGAGHCSCSGNTMNASITCANNFSSGTINTISNKRDSVNCLNGGGPPASDFLADKLTGGFPLKVRFTDASDGAYTTWAWNFGDGGTSTDDNPSHIYGAKGTYTVSLTVSGPAGSDTLTRVDYIDVTDQVLDFTDLGGGTGWQFGIVPELEASSSLVAGQSFDLLLQTAPPNAVSLAWISFASTPLNVLGGTIHANPPSNQLFFPTNFLGALNLSTTWPAGVPAGTELYIQFLIGHPAAQDGISLSNGITAITP